MPEQDDIYVAFHALQQGDVSREQLLESLYAMLEDRIAGLPVRSLGSIFVQKRYLPQQRLKEIITANAMPGMIPEEATRSDSIKLGQLLAMAGVCTYSQVMEALLQQETGRDQGQPRMRIGEYLVSMGYTTPQAIQRALSYQRKAVYSCRKCNLRFNIVNAQADQLYQCVRCQGQLKPEPDSVQVDESAIVEAVQQSASPPAMTPIPLESDSLQMERVATDRAVARHFAQGGLKDAALETAQHWQLEIAQFGLQAPLVEILRRMRAIPDDTARRVKTMDFTAAVDQKQVIPGYRITGRVTSGPYAAIFSAQPQFTPSPIGVKILHPELATSEEAVARFKNDAGMLIRFDHPGIVKGYEFGSTPLRSSAGTAVYYVTLEFLRGTTLDQLIGVKGRLPVSRAVALTLDVAHALKYLEKEGFSHGEVRAEFVLIDDRHRGRLLDAGAAAPLAAKPAAVGKDVFALGRLLRMMLTGTAAAAPDDKSALDFGSVRLPVDLMGVLRSMLHPDPARRFQHFADLVPVLQATVDRTA